MTRNKIVHFHQSGDLLYRMALDRMEKNKLDEAANYCQRALEQDRKNSTYRLLLAQICARMGRLVESNRMLLRILHEAPSLRAVAYYELGNNLQAMGDTANAADSLNKCLENQPDEFLAMDAEDLLDYLACENEEANALQDVHAKRAQEMLQKSREAMDANQMEEAIRCMEEALRSQPDFGMNNSLALMYYAKGDLAQARRVAQEALKKDKRDLHAICNMVLLAENEDERAEWLQKVRRQKIQNPEEQYKVGLTMCDVGEHADALRAFERILKEANFDYGILFLAGAAAYNAKEYKKAVSYFEKMSKVYLDDSLGTYYKSVAQDALKGNVRMPLIAYTGQVPPQEAAERVRYLRGWCDRTRDEFQTEWKTDSRLRRTLLWALQLGDAELQKLLVYMLILLGNDEAEDILRDMLLHEMTPQAMKETVIFALASMGAEQPYLVYSEKGVLEVQVQPHDRSEEEQHD